MKNKKKLSMNWKALFVIVGVVAFAGVVAVFTVAGLETETEKQRVDVEGQPIQVSQINAPPGQDPSFGHPAPKVVGSDWVGNEVVIDPADGRAKVIVFLAHWCPHCQAEVPVVQQWLNTNPVPPGVDVYAVATYIDRSRPNWPPDAWLEREGWTVPTIIDVNNKTAVAYGLSAFPYWVIVDKDGLVTHRAAAGVGADGFAGFLELALLTVDDIEEQFNPDV